MARREVEGPAGRPRQADAETGGTAASARCRLMAQSYDCVHCGHYVLDDPSHFYACQRCVSADETLVGDKDRDNAIARLTAAHAGGYLSLEKFDEPVSLLRSEEHTSELQSP